MPSSRRDMLKKKHDAILNALDRCIGWSLELYSLFKPDHPDYAEGYSNILVMLHQLKEFVGKMKGFI